MSDTAHILFETNRLKVRRWTSEDVGAAFEMYGDPAVTRYLGGGGVVKSIDEMRERMDRLLMRYVVLPSGLGSFAVEEKSSGRVSGCVLLVPLKLSEGQSVRPDGRLEIEVGWHLPRWAWGRGYATEGATGMLRHAFNSSSLDEVFAVVFADNVRSVAVAQRLRMKSLGRTTRFYDSELELFRVGSEEWQAQSDRV